MGASCTNAQPGARWGRHSRRAPRGCQSADREFDGTVDGCTGWHVPYTEKQSPPPTAMLHRSLTLALFVATLVVAMPVWAQRGPLPTVYELSGGALDEPSGGADNEPSGGADNEPSGGALDEPSGSADNGAPLAFFAPTVDPLRVAIDGAAMHAVDTAAARARAVCGRDGLGASDPLQRLAALAPVRAHGVRMGIESRWARELAAAAATARAPDGRLDGDRVARLAHLAPGWPTAIQLERDLYAQRVDDALRDGAFDRAVDLANHAWLHFDVDEQGRALVERARRARLTSVLVDDASTRLAFEHALQDVRVLERIAPAFDGEAAMEAIVGRFQDVTADRPNLDDANAIQRHVLAWAVARDTDAARTIAGYAHYIAASHYWQRRRHWIGMNESREMREHLDHAAALGYRADPEGLATRLFLANAAPFGLPILFAGLLGLIAFAYSRGLRRRLGRLSLRHAERLRASGRSVEAATAWLRAWHLTERLTLLERRDQIVLARAADALLRDALERGQLADAARWADRLADLPFEFWPDNFEAVARRVGVDVQARARQTLSTPV